MRLSQIKPIFITMDGKPTILVPNLVEPGEHDRCSCGNQSEPGQIVWRGYFGGMRCFACATPRGGNR